jgi:Fur family ferric uptake transcriptional regulator
MQQSCVSAKSAMEKKRRNTPIKKEILSLLTTAGTALCQEDIEEKLIGKANRVTIYRVLNAFCEDGIVHKIISDEGKTYFAPCHSCSSAEHNDDHFHFRCRNCQRIECLPAPVVVPLPRRYIAEHTNCWVTGICRRCR